MRVFRFWVDLRARMSRGAASRWRHFLPHAVVVMLLAAFAVSGQSTEPSAPPQYCYGFNAAWCGDSLDKAEAFMRADPDVLGLGSYLEQAGTQRTSATSAFFYYKVKNRPADTLTAPMYQADLGPYGAGAAACSPRAEDPSPEYDRWCASEVNLIYAVEAFLRTKWTDCSVDGTSALGDYGVGGLTGSTLSVRGTVRYGARKMRTTGRCSNAQTIVLDWNLDKHRGYYCREGFYPATLSPVNDATLAEDTHCLPKFNDLARIRGPIQQCGGCPASPNPIYPATGEKGRTEPDFEFAGRVFTRYYHSLHQFRPNQAFAIGWSHTYSATLISTSSTTIDLVDDSGTYESFKQYAAGRFRGENSTDRVIETVNAGGIGWRLRNPGGESWDFDTSGRLLAIRDPDDASVDVTLTYSSQGLTTITDARGRSLRFAHSNNLVKSITLPDGQQIRYGYDTQRNLTTVDYGNGQVRTYHYAEVGLIGDVSQLHHLTGITAENGKRFASFRYDSRGRVIESRVFGTPNEVATATYDTEDHTTVQTTSGGARGYTMQPGTYRRILGVADSTGNASGTYDAEGRLQRIVDRRGVVTEYEYQPGYRSATTRAVGTPEQRREEVTRDPSTHRVTETRIFDAAGTLRAKTGWSYNGRNQVTAVTVTDPATNAARTTSILYCEAADVTAGNCPTVGLVTSVDGPRTDTLDVETFTYRMTDDPACATTPTTCAWRKGDLWKTTNALGHVIEVLKSDGAGRPLSVRDANGVVTDAEYHPRGWLLATKVRGTNDASEADDRITRFAYTATGAVQSLIGADGNTVTFAYDDADRLTTITDRDGNTQRFTLNAAGERVREDTRDTSGALLRTLSRTYDTLGRLQAVTDAYGRHTTFAYDADDNLVASTDALGRVTQLTWDALGRQTRTVQDANGIASAIGTQYDALDRLIRVIDPKGLATSYQYNAFGEVVSQTSPDTGATTSTYDVAGLLKTRTDARGVTATYAYDALGRITSVGYPDSTRNVTYVYDIGSTECPAGERFPKGRLVRMADASGDTTYCYDRYGQLSRKLQQTQGRPYVLRELNTDPRGRLPGQDYTLANPPPGNQHIGTTYPDGSSVRIVRDGQMRPIELRVTYNGGATTQTLLHSGSYYPFGPVAQWTFGNGRQLLRSRNQNYEPGFVEDATAGGISEGYQFDAVGNLVTLRSATQADPAKRQYGYDGLDRLTTVRDGATNAVLQAYAYDTTGNRTSRIDGGATTAYGYAPGNHWLTQIGTQTRQYDAVGNTLRIQGVAGGGGTGGGTGGGETPPGGDPGPGDPGPGDPPPGSTESVGVAAVPQLREFEYDDANRMRTVKHDSVVAMRYLYNGRGERVHRTGPDTTVTTVYDDAGRWIGDYDVNGQPIQQVIWLDDLPVGLLAGAGANQKLYYIEADALGSPRVVIDPVRNVAVWRWNLDGEAFGDNAPVQDADGDGVAFVFDMRFPGQRYDAATGFNYNYFRDYDAASGRYAQSDPIGLDGGISTYGYVGANSLVRSDSKGLYLTLLLREVLRFGARRWLLVGVGGAAAYSLTPAGHKNAMDAGKALDAWAFNESAQAEEDEEELCPDEDEVEREGKKLPRDRLVAPPGKRGNAPIGDDGHPVELHHDGQAQDSPLDEMTRTEHRGKGNFTKNHPNTGQQPSQIDRVKFNQERREYWQREWDSGRFNDF